MKKAVEKSIQNTPSSSTTVGKFSIFSPKRKVPINIYKHSMGESLNKRRKVNLDIGEIWRGRGAAVHTMSFDQ